MGKADTMPHWTGNASKEVKIPQIKTKERSGGQPWKYLVRV